MTDHATDILQRQRFEFGENWMRFLESVGADQIALAQDALGDMLNMKTLLGKRFLDIGSGSGLSSLAARRLGAEVHSFDYDPRSVACTEELKRRYMPGDPMWRIEAGSVLDHQYLGQLPKFDIVYSWGVLHHTGSLWSALANAAALVDVGGTLFVALYNDNGRRSVVWKVIKRGYCNASRPLRLVLAVLACMWLWGPTTLRDVRNGQPGKTWRSYGQLNGRGMSPWRDVVDWVGGYPFEVSKSDDVVRFCRNRGFELERCVPCIGGDGCNEFVFVRTPDVTPAVRE